MILPSSRTATYAYVANNPATWVHPSGHSSYEYASFAALVLANPMILTGFPLPWIIIPATAVIVCALDIAVEYVNGQALLQPASGGESLKMEKWRRESDGEPKSWGQSRH